MRKMTVRRILEVLQSRGPSTRADLTRYSGISAPTVSKAVGNLMELGLLEEGDAPETGVGRPGKVLRLATAAARVIGVVLDAHHCTLVSAGLDGKLHPDSTRSVPTPGTYAALIDSLEEAANSLIASEEIATLGIGISVPGLINRRSGRCVFSPNLHLTNGRSPADDLGDRLGLEAVMLQETHALCLAERMHGARDIDNFAMLDVSTGLGLGVITGGQVLEGQSGMAGELGHITIDPVGRLCGCGNRGCLETLATDSAFVHLLSERLGRVIEIEEAVDQIRKGELQAADELNRTCEYLAIAMAAVINLFNPRTLFVHGNLLRAQDGLFEHLLELTRRRALAPSLAECEIIQAGGSKRQGAVSGIIHHLTDSVGPSIE